MWGRSLYQAVRRVVVRLRDESVADQADGERAHSGKVEPTSQAGCGLKQAPDWYDPEAIQSRRDIRYEAGMSLDEFVTALLEAGDGRLWQSTFVDLTGVSPTTISRWMQELEANGVVSRVEVAGQNLVCLPAAVPSEE